MITSTIRESAEKRLAEIDEVVRKSWPPLTMREGEVFRSLTIELKAMARGLLDAAPLHAAAPKEASNV